MHDTRIRVCILAASLKDRNDTMNLLFGRPEDIENGILDGA